MGTIEQRPQDIEYPYHRARRVHRALAVGIIAILCITGAQRTLPDAWGQKMPDTIPRSDQSQQNEDSPSGGERTASVEADRFVLVDRQGRPRARLVANSDGPALRMFDEMGKRRLELSVTGNGPALHLLDPNESPVASLRMDRDGTDAHLEIRSSQGSTLTQSSGISINDRDENQRLLLALVNGQFFPPTNSVSSPDSDPPRGDSGSQRYHCPQQHHIVHVGPSPAVPIARDRRLPFEGRSPFDGFPRSYFAWLVDYLVCWPLKVSGLVQGIFTAQQSRPCRAYK